MYVISNVDGINRGHPQLGGAIDDCSVPSVDCQLTIRKRAAVNQDGVFYFQGLISDAGINFDRALTAFPNSGQNHFHTHTHTLYYPPLFE